MKAYIIITLGIIYNLQAIAQTDKILDITTQSDSNISEMHINRSEDGFLESLKYEDQIYSLEQLTTQKIIHMKTSGIDVVSLFLKNLNSNNYKILITYLYQFKLLGSEYKNKILNAYFSSAENRYIIIDPDNDRNIHRLHFLTNYNSRGKEVGISKIETL